MLGTLVAAAAFLAVAGGSDGWHEAGATSEPTPAQAMVSLDGVDASRIDATRRVPPNGHYLPKSASATSSSSTNKESVAMVKRDALSLKMQRAPRSAAMTGFERAAVYNNCNAYWSSQIHHINVVHSEMHKFTYFDNVKAGSTTIRGLLGNNLGESWFKSRDGTPPEKPAASAEAAVAAYYAARDKARAIINDSKHNSRELRFSSTDYTQAQLNATFKFSMVRDPVAKFESGVRQAWHQNSSLSTLTADDLLDRQLTLPLGRWLNEHLQPSTYQLSGWSKRAAVGGWRKSGWSKRGIGSSSIDFVGALETFDIDWGDIVRKLAHVNGDQKQGLLSTKIGNSRHDDEGRSKLSRKGILRMCQSQMYGDEWRCLGYPNPCPQ